MLFLPNFVYETPLSFQKIALDNLCDIIILKELILVESNPIGTGVLTSLTWNSVFWKFRFLNESSQ